MLNHTRSVHCDAKHGERARSLAAMMTTTVAEMEKMMVIKKSHDISVMTPAVLRNPRPHLVPFSLKTT